MEVVASLHPQVGVRDTRSPSSLATELYRDNYILQALYIRNMRRDTVNKTRAGGWRDNKGEKGSKQKGGRGKFAM